MDHEPVLIATIAIGLIAAFVGGLIAQAAAAADDRRLHRGRRRRSARSRRGFIADPSIALELAEHRRSSC